MFISQYRLNELEFHFQSSCSQLLLRLVAWFLEGILYVFNNFCREIFATVCFLKVIGQFLKGEMLKWCHYYSHNVEFELTKCECGVCGDTADPELSFILFS